jgi:alkylhydroperoxidase family enzyme
LYGKREPDIGGRGDAGLCGKVARSAKHFDQPELAQLISLVLAINAWNRIGVTCRLEPGT